MFSRIKRQIVTALALLLVVWSIGTPEKSIQTRADSSVLNLHIVDVNGEPLDLGMEPSQAYVTCRLSGASQTFRAAITGVDVSIDVAGAAFECFVEASGYFGATVSLPAGDAAQLPALQRTEPTIFSLVDMERDQSVVGRRITISVRSLDDEVGFEDSLTLVSDTGQVAVDLLPNRVYEAELMLDESSLEGFEVSSPTNTFMTPADGVQEIAFYVLRQKFLVKLDATQPSGVPLESGYFQAVPRTEHTLPIESNHYHYSGTPYGTELMLYTNIVYDLIFFPDSGTGLINSLPDEVFGYDEASIETRTLEAREWTQTIEVEAGISRYDGTFDGSFSPNTLSCTLSEVYNDMVLTQSTGSALSSSAVSVSFSDFALSNITDASEYKFLLSCHSLVDDGSLGFGGFASGSYFEGVQYLTIEELQSESRIQILLKTPRQLQGAQSQVVLLNPLTDESEEVSLNLSDSGATLNMKPGSVPFGDGFTEITVVAGSVVGTSRTQRQYASETIGVEFFGDELRVVRLKTPMELIIPIDQQLIADLGAEVVKGARYVPSSDVWDDKIRYEYDSVSSKLTIFIDSIEVRPHQASALRTAEAVSVNTSNGLLQRSLFGSLLWLIGGGGGPGVQNPTPPPVPEVTPTPSPEGPPPGTEEPGAPTSTPGEEGVSPTPSQETEPETKERSARIVGIRKVKDEKSQQRKKKGKKKNRKKGKRKGKRIVVEYAIQIEDSGAQVVAAANDLFKIVWVVSSQKKQDPWKSKKIAEATLARVGNLTEHLQRVKGPRGSTVHMQVWKMGVNGLELPSDPVSWKLR